MKEAACRDTVGIKSQGWSMLLYWGFIEVKMLADKETRVHGATGLRCCDRLHNFVIHLMNAKRRAWQNIQLDLHSSDFECSLYENYSPSRVYQAIDWEIAATDCSSLSPSYVLGFGPFSMNQTRH